jgi:hypothetical protein
VFFLRIEERGWDDARRGCRCSLVTCRARTIPCPRALDDATAAKLLRRPEGPPDAGAVTVEMLLRTGLRVSARTAGRWTGTPSPG